LLSTDKYPEMKGQQKK